MSADKEQEKNIGKLENVEQSGDTARSENGETKERELSGSYMHSIDAKGRVIIPQALREELGENIVIATNTIQDSIAVYPRDAWEEKRRMLIRAMKRDYTLEKHLVNFQALSFTKAEYDPQGRILIPNMLRKRYLEGAQEVLISGAYDHVRIISQEMADEEYKISLAERPQIMQRIADALRASEAEV